MADYFKIRKDGDPIYEIYLIERGKKAIDGVKYLRSFDELEESEGFLFYRRNGRDSDLEIKGDYDLMIESVGEADYSSIRFVKERLAKPFTVYQIEAAKLARRYEDPRLVRSTDTFKVKAIRSWLGCTIKDAEGLEALIAGIRREIALGSIGI